MREAKWVDEVITALYSLAACLFPLNPHSFSDFWDFTRNQKYQTPVEVHLTLPASAWKKGCLILGQSSQDMVLMHHEVEVDFPNGRRTENHRATLLECGRTKNGKTTTAMALTVGIPAAIGALRISAKDALVAEYFWADPLPCHPKRL